MIKVGNKGIADILVGNRAVKAIYRGATLVWQKIQKLLSFGNNELIGIEFIPNQNIVLTDISIFQNDNISNGWTWICHESGFCVARQTSNGVQSNLEIYGLNGTLKTISSLGSITLYAGQKYYIFYKKDQWDNNSEGTQFAYYQGETGNYKVGKIDGGTDISQMGETIDDVFYLYTNQSKFPYKGIIGIDNSDSVAVKNYLISLNLTKNNIFNWSGAYCSTPYLDGPNAYYVWKVKTNLTNLITITENDLNQYNSAVQKYAYCLMRAGTAVGRCIRYLPTNSIQYEGTDMFGGPDNLYEILWPMYSNKITSMTPVIQEPSDKGNYHLYYKGVTTGSDWSGITDEAVVIYINGSWQKATKFDTIFTKYTWGNQGIIQKITDNYIVCNNAKYPVSTDKKYYLRINGNEV